MSKTYQCPACQNTVDGNATICSNKACRAELGVCYQCRDITTYNLVEERESPLRRNLYRCDRCQGEGVKCITWLSGGYCNGFARSGSKIDRPFCPGCSSKASEVGRSILSWSVIGALGGLIRRK